MTPPAEPIRRRLGQIAGLCVTGQSAAAELELADWLRQADCPPAARVMLAVLLARRGAIDQACCTLDPRSHDPLEMLTLLALRNGGEPSPDAVAAAIDPLHAEFSHLPFVRQWLELIGEPPAVAAPAWCVEQLAAELLGAPQVIRTLVVAQQHEPDRRRIALLRRAVERIAPEFARSPRLVSICWALAELAMLDDDADEARRWAHRGLKVDPYHASLALVLAQLADDPAVGPPAAQILDRVSRRQPTYPDVRAALIRRERRDGSLDAAKQRLAQWLADDPASGLARQLEAELEQAA